MDPVLLIFIVLALAVIFKLISVLGTREGHEQRHELEPGENPARPTRAEAAKADLDMDPRRGDTDEDDDLAPPRPVKPVSAVAAKLQAEDPAFDERGFINGAKAAYEMIVEAFAGGDLKSIRAFLDQSVYEAFRDAVSGREAASQTIDLKFVGIDEARLVSGEIENGVMRVAVDFVSNQVRTTYGPDGEIVDGNPNRIDLVRDRWTFERPLNARDPNWILSATGGMAD